MRDKSEIYPWIDAQARQMLDLVTTWSNINSHYTNLDGLRNVTNNLRHCFGILGGKMNAVQLPKFSIVDDKGMESEHMLAPILTIEKRPKAAKQALFVCHMDVVYPKDTGFDKVGKPNDGKITGPGVTDAKGGIAVMLKTLEALERMGLTDELGWKVIINTDEEAGSPGSGELLEKEAAKFHAGFVFEPTLPNGHLVGTRKGSGNFLVIARGKAAHAGREHDKGRNAIVALAQTAQKFSDLTNTKNGLTVNVGVFHGGVATNVVPDLAIARVNVRFSHKKDQAHIEEAFKDILQSTEQKTKVRMELKGGVSAPPKPMDAHTENLFNIVRHSGKELGIKVNWEDSGGVCDGNRLAAAGLPTVDTLGVVGGNIHSHDEYLQIDSLVERTKLAFTSIVRWMKDG